jgi:hypothetical protein
MPRFKVLTPLKFDGDLYEPGEMVEMSEKQAAAIPHCVQPLAPPKGVKADKGEQKNGNGEGEGGKN